MLLWLGFIICTGVILYSGTKLSKYADIVAEKTGLGRTFVGFVFLAAATSMPELINGISAVAVVGAPDIAVGDIFGSCTFNLLIIAFMDAFYRPQPIYVAARPGHVISAGFGILLLSVGAAAIFLSGRLSPIGWVGPYSLVFVVVYAVAMRLVRHYEKRTLKAFHKEVAGEPAYAHLDKSMVYRNFALNAAVVVAAAVVLPKVGEGLAESTGLGQTFVGTIFIALSTSLPEIVVSVATVKIRAVDLAIGNVFGSNIFNVLVLAVEDLFFVEGPLFSYTDPHHIVPALSAIAMSSIAIIGLSYKAGKKKFFIAWDSLALMAIFALNMAALYLLR
jgi:cation:H+ antiporter